jgi:hypothetical protein
MGATLETPEEMAERLHRRNVPAHKFALEGIRARDEQIAARVRLIVEEYAEGQRNDIGAMLDALYDDLRGAP